MECVKINSTKCSPFYNQRRRVIPFCAPDVSTDELILKIKNNSYNNNAVDKLLQELQIMNYKLLELNNDIEKTKYYIEIAKVKQNIVKIAH